MKDLVTSSFWLFFYAFFIVSFVPFFVIRFAHEQWVYELLYRPNGMVENMTTLMYFLSACFSGWVIFKHKLYGVGLFISFAWAVFIFGEEIRWGLGLFVDDLRSLYLTSVQDIMMFVAKGIPDKFPLSLVIFLFVCRIIFFSTLVGGVIAAWYYRHRWGAWKARIADYYYSPYLILYGLLFAGVIILELFIQPGPRKLDNIEETFELNAALIWLCFSYDASYFAVSRKRAFTQTFS